MRKVKVAIIGAGSAGLSARREVAKVTDDYIVIDNGILGTTCARVGCMPSKVLIQAANDYYRKKDFETEGILGAEKLSLDGKAVMAHVQSLRDRFVRGVMGGMKNWQETHFLKAKATFVSPTILDCDGEKIEAQSIIIATGSKPNIPEPLIGFERFLISTDQIFEIQDLPKNLAVCGLGVIGLELGQAFHRLGVNVLGIARRKSLGGLIDPEILDYAVRRFSEEMNLSFEGITEVKEDGDHLILSSGEKSLRTQLVLVTTGRNPNLKGLGLGNIIEGYTDGEIPEYHEETFKLKAHNNIYLVGDVNGQKQILHEASDEGRIAGFNCVHAEKIFRPRTPLTITFTDPNIASAGLSFSDLMDQKIEFKTGKVTFEGQGRSIVKLKEIGLLHVYGCAQSGKILGAEMFGPDNEHLAHMLSWAMAKNMTVNEALSMPFYHPVIQEGLRTALRDLQGKLNLSKPDLEMERI